MYMAGTLWKWTNYINGWQERWFVLDNGVLSYYKSEDDVNSGCKGSLKMSVCDIVVHVTDTTRLDLIIPGEQHYYVRTSSPQERQEWLVALGTSKASKGKIMDQHEMPTFDVMRTKRSELRLYCDLLMQQVHMVKAVVTETDHPDMQKLNDATSLISPTCDTFIKTLEECMSLIQRLMPFEGSQSPITDAALPPSPLRHPSKKGKHYQRQNSVERMSGHSRSPSVSSTDTTPPSRQNSRQRTASDSSLSHVPEHDRLPVQQQQQQYHHQHQQHQQQNQQHYVQQHKNVQCEQSDSKSESRLVASDTTALRTPQLNNENKSNYSSTSPSSQKMDQTDGSIVHSSKIESDSEAHLSDGDLFLDPLESKVSTFFSDMKPSFTDITICEEDGIPVEPFLDACKCLVPIFDKLSATAFSPVKMDFQGNIRKVRTKYLMHPEQFSTLQSIILHEVASKQHHLPSSATMALLWMKRSLEFIVGFLMELGRGEENLTTAATQAYSTSLKPYHGWVVRGVFAVAVKALPYREVFISLLNNGDTPADSAEYQTCLHNDMEVYIAAVNNIIHILNTFFRENNLDTDEQI